MTRFHFTRGFTLVELLVGMAIGLIASVIIFEAFSVSERQKRTTTGAADAQSNGAIALSLIGRDVRSSGWGTDSSTFGNCDNVYSYYDDGVNPAGPIAGLTNLVASVIITNDASGDGSSPDSITIKYFANPSDSSGANFKVALTSLRLAMDQPYSDLAVKSVYGCNKDNLLLVQQNANCTVMGLTNVTAATLTLEHKEQSAPTYNPSDSYQTTNSWPKYAKGANVQCLPNPGSSGLYQRTYSIDTASRQLQLSEPNSAGITETADIAPNIVDIQAQYGVADAGSQQVNAWPDAKDAWAGSLSAAQARRIKAIRVAIVARSEQYEKPDAGVTECSTTTAAQVASWSTWATFNPESYSSDWKCYRYKVFESVIPLRNIIWAAL